MTKRNTLKKDTDATQAKKTEDKDTTSEIVIQVMTPDKKKIQKKFREDRKPVSAVLVQMNAPDTAYHKQWSVLCFTSKESKARADLNRVTRLYISEKSATFTEKRYLDVTILEGKELKTVKKFSSPEDRSCFKAAKIARGEIEKREPVAQKQVVNE